MKNLKSKMVKLIKLESNSNSQKLIKGRFVFENSFNDYFVFKNLDNRLKNLFSGCIVPSFCNTIIVIKNANKYRNILSEFDDHPNNVGSRGGFRGELNRINSISEVAKTCNKYGILLELEQIQFYAKSQILRLNKNHKFICDKCICEGVSFWKFEKPEELSSFVKYQLDIEPRLDIEVYSVLISDVEKTHEKWYKNPFYLFGACFYVMGFLSHLTLEKFNSIIYFFKHLF